jgi:chitinase
MRARPILVASGTLTVVAALAVGGMTISQAATAAARAPAVVAPRAVPLGGAPYIFPATSNSPNPVTAMKSTGVKAYTLAFILARSGCNPAWDGSGSLTGSAIVNRINAIRNAGGDVVVSFGGFSGSKLGNACGSAAALAGAYQKVIDAYKLRAIDIDLEAGEVSQGAKVIQALKITKQKNPSVQLILTLGVGTNGLEGGEARLPALDAAAGSPVDVWTVMPFDFGGQNGANMGKLSVSVTRKVHAQLKSTHKNLTDAQIYAKQGISSMNGKTDVGETVKVSDFQTMLGFAQSNHLARFTFWTINRDRGNCGKTSDTCSGISQKPLDFTKVIGQFHG